MQNVSNVAEKDEILYEEIEAEEATSGELFYDLFFVANLTTITSVHYMTDYNSQLNPPQARGLQVARWDRPN